MMGGKIKSNKIKELYGYRLTTCPTEDNFRPFSCFTGNIYVISRQF